MKRKTFKKAEKLIKRIEYIDNVLKQLSFFVCREDEYACHVYGKTLALAIEIGVDIEGNENVFSQLRNIKIELQKQFEAL